MPKLGRNRLGPGSPANVENGLYPLAFLCKIVTPLSVPLHKWSEIPKCEVSGIDEVNTSSLGFRRRDVHQSLSSCNDTSASRSFGAD
jgi:hypothetical protein